MIAKSTLHENARCDASAHDGRRQLSYDADGMYRDHGLIDLFDAAALFFRGRRDFVGSRCAGPVRDNEETRGQRVCLEGLDRDLGGSLAQALYALIAAFSPFPRTLGTPRSRTRTGAKQLHPSFWRSRPGGLSALMEVHHEPTHRTTISRSGTEVRYATAAGAATRKPSHRHGLPRQLPLAAGLCVQSAGISFLQPTTDE